MDKTADTMLALFEAMSPWEGVAVALALAYLVLAAREHIACWYCALLSTAIFTALFWDVSLLMESALNVYYMAMAVYGWQQWRGGATGGAQLRIHTWRLRRHLIVLLAIVILSAVSGFALWTNTQAAWPFVDSFTTWASVITTVMVARKVLENWIYWFVIDVVSIPLYLERGLYLTALLFVAYLVIVVFGFLSWRKRCNEQASNA